MTDEITGDDALAILAREIAADRLDSENIYVNAQPFTSEKRAALGLRRVSPDELRSILKTRRREAETRDKPETETETSRK